MEKHITKFDEQMAKIWAPLMFGFLGALAGNFLWVYVFQRFTQ